MHGALTNQRTGREAPATRTAGHHDRVRLCVRSERIPCLCADHEKDRHFGGCAIFGYVQFCTKTTSRASQLGFVSSGNYADAAGLRHRRTSTSSCRRGATSTLIGFSNSNCHATNALVGSSNGNGLTSTLIGFSQQQQLSRNKYTRRQLPRKGETKLDKQQQPREGKTKVYKCRGHCKNDLRMREHQLPYNNLKASKCNFRAATAT